VSLDQAAVGAAIGSRRQFASRTGRRPPRLTVLAGSLVGALTLLPVLYLLVRASEAGTHRAAEVLFSGRTLRLLQATGLLMLSVTVTAVLIALPLAWLVTSTDIPFRRLLGVLAPLPLALPSYVAGFAFVAALGPRGFLQTLLSPFGVDRLPEIYGFAGAWLVLSLITYPYVFLTARGALEGLDPSIEEAARTLGERTLGVLRRVVIPSLKPATGAGALLVALYTLHDFGAVSLLRFDTFTRAIYLSYRGSFDRTVAAGLSLVLVAFSLLAVAVERRASKRRSYHRVHSGGGAARRIVHLGRLRWPAFGLCSSVLILALGVPLGTISYWMLKGLEGGRGTEITARPAWNSIMASSSAAILVVLAAWPIAMLAARFRGKAAAFVAAVPYTGYALPGLVVALGLVFFSIQVTPRLYQTQVMLMLAYLILFLPQAAGAIRASLLQINPQLEEAAQTLGRGRIAILRKVVVPLSRPGILTGAALVFLTVMKELPATLLLAPPGFATLATQVWGATAAASFALAAPPALFLVLLSALPMALLVRLFGSESRLPHAN
jgi:iron(III) transport system permease protein